MAMTWCFEDEATALSEAVLERLARETALVPAIWPFEVANVLVMAERRRRLTEAKSAGFLGLLAQLPIMIVESNLLHLASASLAVARLRGVSAYDAAYIDLAMREAVPLATCDKTLARAANAAGVALVGAR
jgi:predicted nucleic acid-binding protein